MNKPRRVALAALLLTGASAGAQAPIPIRQVASPSATTTTTVGAVAGVKQLPNGGLLVNDPVRRQLVVFAQDLKTLIVSADSVGTGSRAYPRFPAGGLYEYLGDSTLFVDMDSRAFVVIDPTGNLGHAMAHPKPNDLMNMNVPYAGTAGADPQGRFVYRSGSPMRMAPRPGDPPPPQSSRDTVSIVRADFDKRAVDTIAQLTIPKSAIPTITGTPGKYVGVSRVNPVPPGPDDWAVLSDGSIAIVRSHDYHIDWIYADGTRASTPKMAFDWRRLTDEEKQAKIDSVKRIVDSVTATGRPYGMTIRFSASPDGGPTKPDTIIPRIEFVSYAEMGDYVAPIRSGSAKPDRDGNLWILPMTTLQAHGGLLYDVVNKKGEIFERVQLPANRSIAGFGRGGIVYLLVGDRARGYTIERTTVIRGAVRP